MVLMISPERKALEIRRAEQVEALERLRLREWRKIIWLILFWNLVSLVLFGMAMAAPSREQGDRYLVAGLLLGYVGMAVTLLFQLLRMQERGDF